VIKSGNLLESLKSYENGTYHDERLRKEFLKSKKAGTILNE
jgi:hypothetical protein